MYRVDLAADAIQQEAILRRQRLDEERKKRILDPKVRTLGIDVDALNEQIRIKSHIKDAEKTRERAYDEEATEISNILKLMDQKINEDKRRHMMDINEFRASQQKPVTRREFDLNDPEGLKKSIPARVDDSDPRCGPSSLQKFFGEDLEEKERIKMQKEQMSYWVQQQLNEKTMRERELEESNRLADLQATEILQRRKEMEEAEQRLRSAIALETKETNLTLAEIKKQRDNSARRKELEDNHAEIHSLLTSDFMTENPEQARSRLSAYRVRCDMFKGISPEERQRIFEEQERQRLELQAKRERERLEQQEWDVQEAANIRAAQKLERERQRQQKELAERLRRENADLAKSFRQTQTSLNKVIYTNDPTEAYHAQFSTTSR